ncbi:MAG: hypothetical protein ABSF26_28280 [Thermoguttaceae bacterium]|jgi:hypothetical protein
MALAFPFPLPEGASHRMPPISAMIWKLLKWAPVMARAGQAATHVPQPLHIELGFW